jgi:hypothetical protein
VILHIDDIRDVAYTDGAEAIAEIYVLKHKGEKISKKAEAFYEKYMSGD